MLKQYLVVFEDKQKYTFWAEDVEHAISQAEDAEPDNNVKLVYEAKLVWVDPYWFKGEL